MTNNTNPPEAADPVVERATLEAMYRLFNRFTLDDQKRFYTSASQRHRSASRQVNSLRALFALGTGVASALAGLLVTSAFDPNGGCPVNMAVDACRNLQIIVSICTWGAVIMPSLAAALNILADLYQWDRLIAIYDAALENLEVADALSPDPEMPVPEYRNALQSFSIGALGVMADETAQWGQLIRTPEAIQAFVDAEKGKAERASSGPQPPTQP